MSTRQKSGLETLTSLMSSFDRNTFAFPYCIQLSLARAKEL